MTNGDKIRKMSDKELAEYLAAMPGDENICSECRRKYCDGVLQCVKRWKIWLKQEVKDE